MQCSYDNRGNSVPTILLMMQKRLYVERGLKVVLQINGQFSLILVLLITSIQNIRCFWSCLLVLSKAEGIFRINAENSQEEYVRDQLNKGVVPRGIDVHCLAGLIKVSM